MTRRRAIVEMRKVVSGGIAAKVDTHVPAWLHVAGVALTGGVGGPDDLDGVRVGPGSLEHVQQGFGGLGTGDAEAAVEHEERDTGGADLHRPRFVLAHFASELVTLEHTTGVGARDAD